MFGDEGAGIEALGDSREPTEVTNFQTVALAVSKILQTALSLRWVHP